MFTSVLAAALLAALLAAPMAACRSSHAPSGNLARATQLYREAEETRGVDAPLDPVVDQIDQLTRETPETAGDYEELRGFDAVLQQKRADRLAQLEREKKERAQAQAAAQREEWNAPPASAADAGTPAVPVVGAPAKDVLAHYGDCLKADQPFVERGGSRQGTAYALVESAGCKERFPELAGQLVFLAEDKVFNVAPRSAAQRVELRATDGGFEPIAPDAGR